MEQSVIDEIEMSFTFGKRLMEYKQKTLEKMLESMEDNDKTRQHYQADREYIRDVITALETGESIQHLSHIKNRLTIVGQMFFKKEFKALKTLCLPVPQVE